MKHITSKIFSGTVVSLLILSLFPFSVVLAAASFNTDSLDPATLRVMNQTQSGQTNQEWQTSVTASSNNVVSFAVYYHNTSGETARNVRVRFQPQSTSAGTVQQFQAWIRADNAPEITGTVTVNLTSSQSLAYIPNTFAWRPAQTVGGTGTLPDNQTGTEIFSSNGVLLGDIAQGWDTQGSVVINMRVSSDSANQGTLPEISLSLNPTNVTYGQSTSISWGSANASSCTASGGWSGNKSLSGTESTAVYQNTTYTLTCTNSYGQASKSVTAYLGQNAAPTVQLTANPVSVGASGQYTTLSWYSTNATSCSASGGWSGTKSTSGSEAVSVYQNTTYSITCTGNGGSASDGETVTTSQVLGATAQLSVTKGSRNTVLNQTTFVQSNEAQGLDVLEFEIRVRNNGTQTENNVTVRDILPSQLFYVQGSTQVDGVTVGDGIVIGGISLGSLSVGQERVVRFRSVVYFGVDQKLITNQVLATSDRGSSQTGSATVQIRNRGQVLGAGTVVTGPEDMMGWLLVIGFIGAIGIYMISFRSRHRGLATLGSALADARFQYRLRQLTRKKKLVTTANDDIFGNSYQ